MEEGTVSLALSHYLSRLDIDGKSFKVLIM